MNRVEVALDDGLPGQSFLLTVVTRRTGTLASASFAFAPRP